MVDIAPTPETATVVLVGNFPATLQPRWLANQSLIRIRDLGCDPSAWSTGSGDSASLDAIMARHDRQEDPADGNRNGPYRGGTLGENANIRGSEERRPRSLVVVPPPPHPAPHEFRLLQQWSGTVTVLRQTDFEADLVDMTDRDQPLEEAVFDVEEVSPGDRELLTTGAVFRWSIGYRTSLDGQRERVSHLRFVRIPRWRRSALLDVACRAERLRDEFSANARGRDASSG